MRKIIFALSLLSAISIQAQTLVSTHKIKSFTNTQIDSAYTAIGLPAAFMPNDYEVDMYYITYNTVMPDSVTPTVASGLFAFPTAKSCASTILSYHHGTMMTKAEAPSRMGGMEWIIGLAMATEGYIASLPDYIGLGYDMVNNHPYQHARSEATASIDMMRAVREFCTTLNVDLNGQIMLAGYSQGGHATMATHKMIQNYFSSEFNIGASVPMSGPYSMSGVMKDVILQNTPYPAPYYLPYVLLSFQDIYQPYNSVSDFLLTPYNTSLPPMYTGFNGAGSVNAIMPNIPKNIVKPMIIDSIANDPNHKFNKILRDNDVHNWVPIRPVHMLYCSSDKHVPKENAFEAYNYMSAANAPVSMLDISATLQHTECAQMALLQMRTVLDTFRNDKINVRVSEIRPNVGASNGTIQLHILGVEPPYTVTWNTGDTGTVLNNLATGLYSAVISSPNACDTYNQSWFLNEAAPTSSVELLDNQSLVLYPNPGNGKALLKSSKNVYSLKVMNSAGMLVYQTNPNMQNVELDLQLFKPGLYLIQVNDSELIKYVKQ